MPWKGEENIWRQYLFGDKSRQTSTRNNQMVTRSTSSRLHDQRKDHIDSKRLKQRNRSKQLQTHNPTTDDVDNIDSTSKRRDLLLANEPRVVPRGAERKQQKILRHIRVTLHKSTHPKWEQDQAKKKTSYGLAWQQKGMRYGSAKLDYKLPQNVQNISWNHKLYRKNHENLKSWINSRRKKLIWNKDPKRYISGICTINVNIHNRHDATKPHTQKMHSQIQI